MVIFYEKRYCNLAGIIMDHWFSQSAKSNIISLLDQRSERVPIECRRRKYITPVVCIKATNAPNKETAFNKIAGRLILSGFPCY